MFQTDLARMDRADLERYVRSLLAQSGEHATLRAALEEVAAANHNFSGLVRLWGPDVYRRSRVTFRPLILANFSYFFWEKNRVVTIRWSSELQKWLDEAEAAGDIELSRRLIEWQLQDQTKLGWSIKPPVWRKELLRRFEAASTPGARQIEIEKMPIVWHALDEETALRIYTKDPNSSRKFVQSQAPSYSRWEKSPFWERMIDTASRQGDVELAHTLYRNQVPPKRWQEDALKVCQNVRNPEELIAELEQIHPQHAYDLGAAMIAILEERGRDVVPYVIKHMRNVFTGWTGRGDFGKLAKLASQNHWWDLWACAVRTCATTKEFNTELRDLLIDRSTTEAEVRRRLHSLSGVSREWNFSGFGLATIHDLDEDNALAIYDRFPDLLRGPFRVNLHSRYGNTQREQLLNRLIAGGHENDEVIDFIASRYTTNMFAWQATKNAKEVEQLADYYLALRADDELFARRAASVLGKIPAYSIHNYSKLIRENRLARLLFERSSKSYLGNPRAVADLVEASEINVMRMAYRILGLGDPRASALAADHLPLLIGTLFRPLHRQTRVVAFGALENAASHSLEAARTVVARAREALVLPDQRYPKEDLAALIGRVIHRWPQLRGNREQPVIYRRSTPAA